MLRYPSTLFLSAFLLFQVELIVGKGILAQFGGSASIWTTCNFFFQSLLLGGYLYAHLLTTRFSPSLQAAVHGSLLLGSLAFMPLSLAETRPGLALAPELEILGLLSVMIGGPFFLLCSTVPLMQRWFAERLLAQPQYGLYALSNAGSLVAFLSYPFLVETAFDADVQARLWTAGYAAFTVMMFWCLVTLCRSDVAPTRGRILSRRRKPIRLRAARFIRWTSLSALGSALMLATTNHLCLDIAPAPLLWVVPLSIYLLTFIVCFARPSWYDRRVYTLVLLAACAILIGSWSDSLLEMVVMSSVALFSGTMVCHGELVSSRPPTSHSTQYLLAISLGGCLGGIAVAFVAPQTLPALWEFPLSLFGVCCVALAVSNREDAGRQAVPPGFWAWGGASAALLPALFCLHPLAGQATAWPPAAIFIGVNVLIYLTGWRILLSQSKRNCSRSAAGAAAFLTQLGWWALWGFLATPRENCLKFVVAGAVVVFALQIVGLHATRLSNREHASAEFSTLAAAFVISLLGSSAVFTTHDGLGKLSALGAIGVWGLANVVAVLWGRVMRQEVLAKGRPALSAASLAIVLLGLLLSRSMIDQVAGAIHVSRNFYGALRVVSAHDRRHGEYVMLAHGGTRHGFQYTAPSLRHLATAYYGHKSGLELAIRSHPLRTQRRAASVGMRVGVVGLGTGTIAAYCDRHDYYRFYEINPEVAKLAEEHFTYLSDARGAVDIVLGDARQCMEQELLRGRPQNFDVLAVDAFNSDSIPLHLLTQECADIYRGHLKTDGILAIHISNRFLDLNPVVRGLGRHLGWMAIRIESDGDEQLGTYDATWVILTHNAAFGRRREVREAHSEWSDGEPQPLLWTDRSGALWQIMWPSAAQPRRSHMLGVPPRGG